LGRVPAGEHGAPIFHFYRFLPANCPQGLRHSTNLGKQEMAFFKKKTLMGLSRTCG
jgi:hypothetical protein